MKPTMRGAPLAARCVSAGRLLTLALALGLSAGCSGLAVKPTLREGFQAPPAVMLRVSVTRLAGGSVLINLAGRLILTDPFYSEAPGEPIGEPLAARPADLPRV